jgi:virginiamycin B lyase
MNSRHLILTSAASIASLLAFAAAGKDPKPATTPAAAGLSEPGVRIPFASLKAEAEIPIDAVPAGAAFLQQAHFAAGASILRIDPKTNKPAEPIPGLKQACAGLLNAHGHLWAFDCAAGALLKIHAREANLKSALPAETPVALAASADSLWLLAGASSDLQRVDPDQNTIVASLRLPQGCTDLLSAENALWAACPLAGKVLRIDPAANLVDKSIAVEGKPASLAAGNGSLWVFTRDGKIAQIDPKANKVDATIPLGVPAPSASLAFGDGSLWVSLPGFPITRIHAASAKVVQQFHGPGGEKIFHGLNAVWLANASAKSISRFDPKRIAATLAE